MFVLVPQIARTPLEPGPDGPSPLLPMHWSRAIVDVIGQSEHMASSHHAMTAVESVSLLRIIQERSPST